MGDGWGIWTTVLIVTKQKKKIGWDIRQGFYPPGGRAAGFGWRKKKKWYDFF